MNLKTRVTRLERTATQTRRTCWNHALVFETDEGALVDTTTLCPVCGRPRWALLSGLPYPQRVFVGLHPDDL
jgi:hypothetical protein